MKQSWKLWGIIFLLEISLFGITNTCSILAQNFERFSNKEGFNQNSINSIAQDRYGFLWYGTPNGLIFYDGYEFKTYTTQSDTNGNIISNVITHLHNDSDGILWIGTNNGVSVYIPWLEKFHNVPLPIEIYIDRIITASDGRTWFLGENTLYVCELIDIEKGVFSLSDDILEAKLKNTRIHDFNFKDDHTLILATSEGISKLIFENNNNHVNSIKIKYLTSFDSFKEDVLKIFIDKTNMFWIGTSNGLFKTTLDANKVHILETFGHSKNPNKSGSSFITTAIYEDNSGAIWVGTRNNGLYKIGQDPKIFEHFAYNPKNTSGLSSHYIKDLYQDDFNVLWIGTAQGGLNKLDLDQKPFINYSNNPYDSQSISDNLITSILEDSKGRLWLSGYNKPLVRSTTEITLETVNELRFENLEKDIPISDTDIVRIIYEDKKGFIWLGSDKLIVVYNPLNDKFKKVTLKEESRLISNAIRSISQIDDNNILLAGTEIIIIENPWEEIKKSKAPQLAVKSAIHIENRRVQCVLNESKSSFWFGTSKGLIHGVFDGEKIILDQKYTDNKEVNLHLSNKNIFSLHKDGNGNIWVGTYGGGLNKLSKDDEGLPSKITYFRKNDVLPDDAIYGILQEGDLYLWMSTDMGLVKYNIDDNTTSLYDVRDGLAQNNYRENAYFKGKSGFFYFGGLNGLTIFRPEKIKKNIQPPNVLISDLFINNKPIKIGEKSNNKVVLEKSISETGGIVISQNQQSISFNIVAEHTSTPSKNRIAYKLEGFDNQWIENKSGKAMITYTNLPARSYVLKIKAANGDGVWSSRIKSLNIEVLPPWYNTWWSYLLFFLAAVILGIGVIIYFVQLEKLKQRLKYEKLDRERIETVNQGKFRYFTNISHEFRTPLTLIAGPLERVVSQNTDPKNIRYLAIIQKNTKRLLNLIDQLITFRQAEEGQIKLNLVEYTLGEFLYPVTEAFEDYALEKNINFFYKVNTPNEKIGIDIEKFERIIFNLLSNSFKNTPSQGSISIEAGVTFDSGQKIINIDVVDSGKGIPKENIDSIFERFYQLGNKDGEISGGGIGLAFCKSLANLMDGKINAISDPGVETRFSVKIPSRELDNSSLKNSNITKKSFIKNWVPLSKDIFDDTDAAKNLEKQKTHTLLIVENEEDVQNFLLNALSEKYVIIIANNGVEAWEQIKIKQPDMVISDVMMPEMDGYELCNKIKQSPETSHLPVLLLTALGESDDIIKGLEFGADEYLSKPFSLKHLELRIEKLIQNNILIKKYFSKNSFPPKDNEGLELSNRDKDFLKKISDVVQKNISNSNFGVEELSKEIGFSTSHFYRRLKLLTGQVPSVYLRNFRLQYAAELLKGNEGYNASEVMYLIGIESYSYFSKSFKKLHGVSPSQYQKKIRK
ncbi:hypothetical protein PW52_01670 [Tamlana sedimentorum]|uniref:histidine kinase n=1 Tax=Neotamlana sedimentorum TaxID=1435349 RepID=A0A0D7WEQ8_9FLAO|nr:two-component regulator propeller domain-containing protein [Tamlana sedimentorum]KJD37188.1 hypothetical protein PW52_01670 [Tamlana sedimentorum]